MYFHTYLIKALAVCRAVLSKFFNFSVLPYFSLWKVGVWQSQSRRLLAGLYTYNACAVLSVRLAHSRQGITGSRRCCCCYLQLQNHTTLILMLFSGMCLSKIYWEFIRNSMANLSSPKMPLLTVLTFSSWKCKCGLRVRFATGCIVTFLAHISMVVFPKWFWIYRFCWFKEGCMMVDTWW